MQAQRNKAAAILGGSLLHTPPCQADQNDEQLLNPMEESDDEHLYHIDEGDSEPAAQIDAEFARSQAALAWVEAGL